MKMLCGGLSIVYMIQTAFFPCKEYRNLPLHFYYCLAKISGKFDCLFILACDLTAYPPHKGYSISPWGMGARVKAWLNHVKGLCSTQQGHNWVVYPVILLWLKHIPASRRVGIATAGI